jgi:hypothetical protein
LQGISSDDEIMISFSAHPQDANFSIRVYLQSISNETDSSDLHHPKHGLRRISINDGRKKLIQSSS